MTSRKTLTFILLTLFSFGLTAVGRAEPSLAKHSFSIGDQQREYLIFNASKTPKPVVIALHGWRRAGQAVRGERKLDDALYAGLDSQATSHNFTTVYPIALNGMWNLAEGQTSKAWGNQAPPDDIAFITSLVKQLIKEKIADPNRIYLTGFSNGTIMSYRLLCKAGNLFAAAAPVSGTMAVTARKTCNKSNLPPLFAIMGTADPILPYDGWLNNLGGELSIPEVMRVWSEQHKCRGQKLMRLENKLPSSRVQSIVWTGCKKDESVKLFASLVQATGSLPKPKGPNDGTKDLACKTPTLTPQMKSGSSSNYTEKANNVTSV